MLYLLHKMYNVERYYTHSIVFLQLPGHDGEIGNTLTNILCSLDVEPVDDLRVGDALVEAPQW